MASLRASGPSGGPSLPSSLTRTPTAREAPTVAIPPVVTRLEAPRRGRAHVHERRAPTLAVAHPGCSPPFKHCGGASRRYGDAPPAPRRCARAGGRVVAARPRSGRRPWAGDPVFPPRAAWCRRPGCDRRASARPPRPERRRAPKRRKTAVREGCAKPPRRSGAASVPSSWTTGGRSAMHVAIRSPGMAPTMARTRLARLDGRQGRRREVRRFSPS